MKVPDGIPMPIDMGAIPIPLNMEVAATVMPPSLTRVTFGDLIITTSGTDLPTLPGIQATMVSLDEFHDYMEKADTMTMAVRVNMGMFTVACFPFSHFFNPKEPERLGKLEVMADAYIHDLQGVPTRISIFAGGDNYLYVGWAPGVER